VLESGKLTTELRAIVQLTNQMILHLRYPQKPLLHCFLATVRKLYCALGVPWLNWTARQFEHQGMVPVDNPSSLYVCVYVRALKD